MMRKEIFQSEKEVVWFWAILLRSQIAERAILFSSFFPPC
jgi:hypothetical protein